jgi:hypothetical protein
MNQKNQTEQSPYGRIEMSNNKIDEKLTKISKQLDDLEQLISKLCEVFADWTDIQVEESNKPDKKQPQPYIS